MKEIDVKKIEDAIASMTGKIACEYPTDILQAIHDSAKQETSNRSVVAMKMLEDNAKIAQEERIPLCQDTGLVIVWLHVGQDVHFYGGSVKEAVNRGVRKGYKDNYLRASCVNDPLFDRQNTKDNTPAILYTDLVPGESVTIEVMAKGFGSENKSSLKMLTPADGIDGVKKFVLDTVMHAGPNACPPFVIGVGIGGTSELCAKLSKEALLRPLAKSNADPRYKQFEDTLLKEVNALEIGPMGFHGKTTALKVQIEYAPTHIAGLPVAVNMCCHVCRHAKVVIA